MIKESKIKLGIKIPIGTTYEGNKSYLGYPEYSHEMVDNHIIEDTLTYLGYMKGRSSVKFLFSGKEGTRYDLVRKFNVSEIKGKWVIVKRGSNYGISKIIENE
jgi:hypothetical protein